MTSTRPVTTISMMGNEEIKQWIDFVNNPMETMEEKEKALRFVIKEVEKDNSFKLSNGMLNDIYKKRLFDIEIPLRQMERNPNNGMDQLLMYASLHTKKGYSLKESSHIYYH